MKTAVFSNSSSVRSISGYLDGSAALDMREARSAAGRRASVVRLDAHTFSRDGADAGSSTETLASSCDCLREPFASAHRGLHAAPTLRDDARVALRALGTDELAAELAGGSARGVAFGRIPPHVAAACGFATFLAGLFIAAL